MNADLLRSAFTYFLYVVEGELLPLLGLILVFWFLGNFMAHSRPRMKQICGAGAIAAFLIYMGYGAIVRGENDTEALAALAIRGLFAAALVYAVSLVILPIVAILRAQTVDRALDAARRMQCVRRARAAEQQVKHQVERASVLSQQEQARQEPERNRRTQELAEQTRQAADAQLRRENARMQCELLFQQHCYELKDRYTCEMLEAVVAKYMTDGHDPTYVEQRGEELQATIRQILASTGSADEPQTLDSLTAWFEATQLHIMESQLEQTLKATHLAELEQEYSEGIRRILQRRST